MNRIIPWLALALACCLLAASPSSAHDFNLIINNAVPADPGEHLLSSSPYDGQVLNKAPDAIILTFSQPVQPDKSSIRVYDSFGTEIAGNSTVSGVAMITELQDLHPGRYRVKWKARCACNDNNDMSDSFVFTIR